jgi:hypothetical protein
MADSLATFFEVLDADLRLLASEAKKTDSLATQITGWLSHTDFAAIKEAVERSSLALRAIAQDGGGVAAVRAANKVRCGVARCAWLRRPF